jgi:hypothetical protein
MSDTPGSNIPLPPRPICPNCKQTIEHVDFYPYPLEKIAAITCACHNCHFLLQTLITILKPSDGPPEDPRVVLPS